MQRINTLIFNKLYEEHNKWLKNKKQGKQLHLNNCSFTKKCLTGKKIQYSIFEECDFSNCDLTDTTFENSCIQKCNFEKSQYLNINAFGFSKIYGTKLPFSYSDKIEAINDHCSKYKVISLVYFIICIYYILFSINLTYVDLFTNKKIDIPNPFFALTGTISYVEMLCFGMIVIFSLDKFLIPLTLEILAMIRTLPVVFSNGEKISTLLSKYFLLRWITEFQLDFHGKLPVKNIRHEYFGDYILQNEYKKIANYSISLFSFLDFICLYLFLYRILHIYFFNIDFLNLDENTLQMFLGSIFIFSINRSGGRINIVTMLLLVITLAVFLDYKGIGTNFNSIIKRESLMELSITMAGFCIISYHYFPKVTRMSSVLPIYIVIILIVYSNTNLTTISLEDVEFNKWNGFCVDEKVTLKNKRFQSANLKNIKASNTDFRNSNFAYADLRGADLRCSNFTNSNIDKADVAEANLRYAIGIEQSICKAKNYSKAKLSFKPKCE